MFSHVHRLSLPLLIALSMLVALTLALAGGCAPPAAPGAVPQAAPASLVCLDPNPSLLSVADAPNGPFFTYADGFKGGAPPSWNTTLATNLDSLDQSMAVFYTGDGNPDQTPLSQGQPLTSLKLGECSASSPGMTRYLILSSCNTFAHGPLTPIASGADPCPSGDRYGCPGKWQWDVDGDGVVDPDNPTMRSVFARWGPALGAGLRMTCGGSTVIYPEYASDIWKKYLITASETNKGMSVADSIIAGLYQDAIPLCLARGGESMDDSPLVQDLRFEVAANSTAQTHYHMQYPLPFSDPYQPFRQSGNVENVTPNFPICLPVLTVDPNTQPLFFPPDGPVGAPKNLDDAAAESEEAYFKQVESRSADEQFFVTRAWSFLADLQDWRPPQFYEREMLDVSGAHLMLTKLPVDSTTWAPGVQKFVEKSALVMIRRRIDLLEELSSQPDLQPGLAKALEQLASWYKENELPSHVGRNELPLIDVLGWGGIIELVIEGSGPNRGNILYASKVWRTIVKSERNELVISPDKAYGEALNQLAAPEAYRLASWKWGYFETSGHNQEQTELKLAYEFRFAPREEEGFSSDKFAPQAIWIAGQTGETCQSE